MTVSTVPVYGGVVPDPNAQSAEDFSTNAVAWTSYQAASLVPGINSSIAEFNIDVGLVNGYKDAAAASAADALVSENNAADSALTAQSLANFKGRWSEATGAATVGSSYSHNGSTWRVEVAIADITLSEPSRENTDWQIINDVNMSNVDLTRLNNPLLHLFAPNIPVVRASGVLSSSRSSIATYIDRYGVIKTSAVDLLREEKEGYLIEQASTNKLLHSEDFSNPVWVKVNATLTGGQSAPDGTSNAFRFQNTGVGEASVRQLRNLATSDSPTVSIWIKSADNSNYTFRIQTADVRLMNFTATGEWQRLDYTAGSGGGVLKNYGITTDLDNNPVDIIIFAAQLEEQPFSTSYIKTTTTDFARAEDDVSIPVLNNLPYTLESYTISARFKNIGGFTGETRRLFSASASVGTLTIFANSAIDSIGFRSDDNITNNQVSGTPSNINDFIVTASFDSVSSTISIYIDGIFAQSMIVTSHPTIDLSGVLAFFAKSTLDPTNRGSGNISNFRVWDRLLNTDEIKLLRVI